MSAELFQQAMQKINAVICKYPLVVESTNLVDLNLTKAQQDQHMLKIKLNSLVKDIQLIISFSSIKEGLTPRTPAYFNAKVKAGNIDVLLENYINIVEQYMAVTGQPL